MKECTFSRFSRNSLSDRRIKARHSAPTLGVTLKRPRFLNLFFKPVPVKCIDINRYGIALECEEELKLGEKVLLDFKGKYIRQSDVQAIVSSVKFVQGKRRYGLTFSYCTDTKYYSREIDNALSRIEAIYNEQYRGKMRTASLT